MQSDKNFSSFDIISSKKNKENSDLLDPKNKNRLSLSTYTLNQEASKRTEQILFFPKKLEIDNNFQKQNEEIKSPKKLSSTHLSNIFEPDTKLSIEFGNKEDLELEINPLVREMLKCISLCHCGKTFYSIKLDKNIIETSYKEEYAMLNLARSYGHSLDKVEREFYYLKINEKMEKYLIYGINHFSSKRKKFSIVCQNLNEESEIVIYCKGPFKEMENALSISEDERIVLSYIIDYYEKKKTRIFVFGKKFLSKEDVYDYQTALFHAKSNLMEEENSIESIAARIETNLQFVGII